MTTKSLCIRTFIALCCFAYSLASVAQIPKFSTIEVSKDTIETIDFLGKKIKLAQLFRAKESNIVVSDRGDYIRWDTFDSYQQAEQAKQDSVAGLIAEFENNRMEKIEPVFFRGNEIEANVIWTTIDKSTVFRGCLFNPYRNIPIYLSHHYFVTETNNQYALIQVHQELHPYRNSETMAFIEHNFMERKYTDHTLPIMIADTIKVPKKVRMPAWSYHDFNTTINGLSVGFSRISSRNNVTSNGIRLELLGSGLIMFPFAFYPYSLADDKKWWTMEETERAERYKNRLDIVNGFNLSLFGSMSRNTVSNGIAVNGLTNSTYKSNGLSISGLYDSKQIMNGIQIAALWSYGYKANGIQIATIGSWANEASGVQISAWNRVHLNFSGLQIGGYNQAYEVRGLQIGIYNNAKILKGLQIGIWNKNGKRSLPLINWGF
jgi:hypothetical protein